jgi:hypothetical protein
MKQKWVHGGVSLRAPCVPLRSGKANRRAAKLTSKYDWLRARLDAKTVTAVLEDFDAQFDDDEARRLRACVHLSAHRLAVGKALLVSQLYGRMLAIDAEAAERIAHDATRHAAWIRCLQPTLMAPGGNLHMVIGSQAASTRWLTDSGHAHLTQREA